MTRTEALSLLKEYCDHIKPHVETYSGRHASRAGRILEDASGMMDRWPSDGSEKKAMRWLGYMQGVLVCAGVFSLDAVKKHSKNKTMVPPWPSRS